MHDTWPVCYDHFEHPRTSFGDIFADCMKPCRWILVYTQWRSDKRGQWKRRMDARNQRMFNVIIFCSLILILGVTILTNLHYWWKLIPLSLLLLLSFLLRRKPIFGKRLPPAIGRLSFVFDLVLLYLISLSDMSRVAMFYFYIEIIDMVLYYPVRQSLIISLLVYCEYVLIRFVRYIKWNYFDFTYFSPVFYEDALYFAFVFLIMYIAKQQMIQKQMLAQTMLQLEERTRQYSETNQKLQETLTRLEEMTTLKERNRIAREIHDTVGHTLTTVLIEIEAGKRLIAKNPAQAVQKLDLAQEQVRKGLNDIRHSVRTLKEGSDLMSLIPSMQSLIRDTEMHAGVTIAFNYDADLPLGEAQGKVLFSALQEGLTNGIRHGRCTEFGISLRKQEDAIVFTIRDNGRGCQKVVPGFGLNAMEERVRGLGGRLGIETAEGRGFSVTITLPAIKEGLDGENQAPDSR